ncbi:DUF563 domain-containing protein [Marinoscillum sp. MHG1-6]|uniref:glycosyltransferase family 61 protein n=1 Tax=Marinoscillum sp. MHG1-6 TaxID=2959627 RepID=UPI0021573448|nr:glycosyltransferase family 61 protein [Marinoscillum sp. MHG1-6]
MKFILIVYRRLLKVLWERWVNSSGQVVDRNSLIQKYQVNNYSIEQAVSFHGRTHNFYPKKFEKKFGWLNDYKKTQRIDKPFYVNIRNAELRGKRCLAIDCNGSLILESSGNSLGYLLRSGDAKYVMFPGLFKASKSVGSAFSLVDSLSLNYYHWVNDLLPMLEAYEVFERLTHERPKIIIDNDAPNYQYEFLEALGFGSEIFTWTSNRSKVDSLLVTSRRYLQVPSEDPKWAKTHILSKAGFDWLRNRLPRSTKLNKRIYVSRSDAGGRKVVNEIELLRMLEEYRFDMVILSNMKVLDQIQLFQEASIVVTAHGAALTNTIFSDSLDVVELFPERRYTESTSTFYQIAHYYGHQYHVVACQQTENENIIVDIHLVKEIVSKILE